MICCSRAASSCSAASVRRCSASCRSTSASRRAVLANRSATPAKVRRGTGPWRRRAAARSGPRPGPARDQRVGVGHAEKPGDAGRDLEQPETFLGRHA